MAYHRPGGNAPKSLLDKQEGWKMNLWMRSTHIQELFTSRYKLLKVHPHSTEAFNGKYKRQFCFVSSTYSMFFWPLGS